MPHAFRSWGMALLGVGVLACGGSDTKSESGGAQGGEANTVDPTSETRQFMKASEDYESWPNFPENTTPEKSEDHRGGYVLAYYNSVVGMSVDSGTLPLEDGAIIVKENFADEGDAEPAALTVMAKDEGRWYYYKSTTDGQVLTGPNGEGLQGYELSPCESCHEGADDNDYVFTHEFAPDGGDAGL